MVISFLVRIPIVNLHFPLLLGGGNPKSYHISKFPSKKERETKKHNDTLHDSSWLQCLIKSAWYIMYSISLKETALTCKKLRKIVVTQSAIMLPLQSSHDQPKLGGLLWYTDTTLPLSQTQPLRERKMMSHIWVTQHCTSNPLYRSCCFNVTCSPVSGSSSHSVHHMHLKIQMEGHKVKKTHTANHHKIHKASMYHVLYCCVGFCVHQHKAGKSSALRPFQSSPQKLLPIWQDERTDLRWPKKCRTCRCCKMELRWNRQIDPFPWAPMYGIPTYIYHKFKSR